MSEQTKYDLPDTYLLQALDDAHEKGFRDFLGHHGYDARYQAHRKQAANALSNLIGGLKKGSDPKYDDRYVAAAYIVNYHLSHCMMAYWAFKGIFDRVDVPNTLYVYDVGAGTGAGRVGLALALSKYDKQPDIYFGAHEPANAMRSAGYFFWQAFRKSVPDYFKDPYIYTPPKEPSKLPANTVRVVTSFHLSLPWDNQQPCPYREEDVESAKNLKEAFRIVSPDLGIFTINNQKKQTLSRVVDASYDWDKEFGTDRDIPKHPGVPSKSPLYTDCAVYFGFEVPEAERDLGKSVRHWSRHRFSLPKDSILLRRVSSCYAERLRRGEAEAKRKATEARRPSSIYPYRAET